MRAEGVGSEEDGEGASTTVREAGKRRGYIAGVLAQRVRGRLADKSVVATSPRPPSSVPQMRAKLRSRSDSLTRGRSVAEILPRYG